MAYMMHENKCLDPKQNITSENQAINVIKNNIDWLSRGHKDHFESLENYSNPVVAKAGKSGNGWGVWETKETSPKRRVWMVMYFETPSNDSFDIECEVACGGAIEGQCWTLNAVNINKK
ncbi:hypothetical protein HNR00_001045 [Methylorubrum rhodinum]|uniref:Uncharacterized protein n=2 Tax=Methylorubrum rhodinum TaxID=29428 RepID=A0A840ZH89_9HYPH|nr:hypothetical protein [Methylorubrum rhodinum]MBB5756347.1 hypothetical protein [Methylorubrum rhodinum]